MLADAWSVVLSHADDVDDALALRAVCTASRQASLDWLEARIEKDKGYADAMLMRLSPTGSARLLHRYLARRYCHSSSAGATEECGGAYVCAVCGDRVASIACCSRCRRRKKKRPPPFPWLRVFGGPALFAAAGSLVVVAMRVHFGSPIVRGMVSKG